MLLVEVTILTVLFCCCTVRYYITNSVMSGFLSTWVGLLSKWVGLLSKWVGLLSNRVGLLSNGLGRLLGERVLKNMPTPLL